MKKRSVEVYTETPTETSDWEIFKGSHPQCNILMGGSGGIMYTECVYVIQSIPYIIQKLINHM